MTARAVISFAPRLLSAPDAAAYLRISETTLRGLKLPRRELGGRRLYDIRHLDAFVDSLPIEGEAVEDDTCAGKFGRAR